MTTSLLTQEMRRTYAAQRGVSQGAHITLASVSGGWQARFECATRCEQLLGNRGWQNEEKTLFLIPMQDMHSALAKLGETFSVALVDTVTDEQGSRFVLVWRIAARVQATVEATTETGDELDGY
jgi:hypothetical protein